MFYWRALQYAIVDSWYSFSSSGQLQKSGQNLHIGPNVVPGWKFCEAQGRIWTRTLRSLGNLNRTAVDSLWFVLVDGLKISKSMWLLTLIVESYFLWMECNCSGIAVGVSPLIPFPAGRYFEVRVDRVRQEPLRREPQTSRLVLNQRKPCQYKLMMSWGGLPTENQTWNNCNNSLPKSLRRCNIRLFNHKQHGKITWTNIISLSMAFSHGYLVSWKFLCSSEKYVKDSQNNKSKCYALPIWKVLLVRLWIPSVSRFNFYGLCFVSLELGLSDSKLNFEGVNLSFIGILYFKFRVSLKTTFQRCWFYVRNLHF